MTKELDLLEIYKVIEMLADGQQGWANAQRVYIAVGKLYNCTPQTARNWCWRHTQDFEMEFGKIKSKSAKATTTKEQNSEIDEFELWLAPRLVLVEECLQYLKDSPQSPDIEALLISLGNARENLNNYSDAKLQNVVMELRKLGFEPKTKIGEE
jgi:hypothetical protein